MEPRKETKETTGRFQILDLEERIAPTVTIGLLGMEIANVHVDAQITGTLPLLGPIDLGVTL
jgi:hypothetical protein